MSAPLLTFDQAIPYLRRGFILRIHGADEYQGAQVREEQGKFQIGFGDNNSWKSAGDVPLFDLQFDVYDQKKVDAVDYTKPLVERDPNAQALTQKKADDQAASELGAVNKVPHVSDEELHETARRMLKDQAEEPSDEKVNNLVEQLRQEGNEKNPVSEIGGGNDLANVEAAGVGVTSETQGLNETDVAQIDNGGVDLSHEVRPGTSGQETEGDVLDNGVPEDASVVTDEGEQTGVGPDEGEEVEEHGRRRKGKHR